MTAGPRRVALVLCLGVTEVAAAQQSPPDLQTFLRDRLGFSADQVAGVTRGAVVARVLATTDPEEIAIAAVARIDAPPALFLDRVRTSPTAFRGSETRQMGNVGNPASATDVEGFILPEADVDALQRCTAGSCKLKLPGDVIAGIRTVDWSEAAMIADTTRAQITRLMREWLVDYLTDYQRRGDSALVIYGDTPAPLALHEGFHRLLAESPYLYEYAPAFHHYLEEFPRRALPGAADRFYWSVDEFGLRPLTTLTHVSIYEPSEGAGGPVIALKQLYASHYFHASLKLIMLAEDDRLRDKPEFYLIYLDRSLFDTRLGGLTRRTVTWQLLGNLRERVAALQRFAR